MKSINSFKSVSFFYNSFLINKTIIFLLFLTLTSCYREVTTPLINKFRNGGKENEIKDMITSGANVNEWSKVSNITLFSPLYEAITRDYSLELIRFMLDNGADVNGGWRGMTPLQMAASWRKTELAKLLLDRGANIYTVYSPPYGTNKTALEMAKENGNMEIVRLINAKEKEYENTSTSVSTSNVTQNKFEYNQIKESTKYQFEKKSDVDIDIPKNQKIEPYRFALIIGNEDYSSYQNNLSSEINVDFARNDATAFKEYAINALGIPEKNLIILLDATTGQMNQGISKLNLLIKNTQGKSEIFVYYAGHGLPDEQTKEAYIMPVDVSGKNASEGIPLKILYSKLTEFPSKRITVFIDACFSGGARNQGLLAARGVKVKPKEGLLNGNLVVFSASSGEQSSLPLKEKYHGIFTYYLLKKIQETKGVINYDELSKSINENVSLQSVLINDKEQTPQINVSNSILNEWKNYNLK